MRVQRRARHAPAFDETLARRIQQSGRQLEWLALLERIIAKWEATSDHHSGEPPTSDLPAVAEAHHQAPPHSHP